MKYVKSIFEGHDIRSGEYPFFGGAFLFIATDKKALV